MPVQIYHNANVQIGAYGKVHHNNFLIISAFNSAPLWHTYTHRHCSIFAYVEKKFIQWLAWFPYITSTYIHIYVCAYIVDVLMCLSQSLRSCGARTQSSNWIFACEPSINTIICVDMYAPKRIMALLLKTTIKYFVWTNFFFYKYYFLIWSHIGY